MRLDRIGLYMLVLPARSGLAEPRQYLMGSPIHPLHDPLTTGVTGRPMMEFLSQPMALPGNNLGGKLPSGVDAI